MRKLTFDLKEVEMESSSWDFMINNQNIGFLIKQQMKESKFIGNIKIVIEETEPIIEEKQE